MKECLNVCVCSFIVKYWHKGIIQLTRDIFRGGDLDSHQHMAHGEGRVNHNITLHFYPF